MKAEEQVEKDDEVREGRERGKEGRSEGGGEEEEEEEEEKEEEEEEEEEGEEDRGGGSKQVTSQSVAS